MTATAQKFKAREGIEALIIPDQLDVPFEFNVENPNSLLSDLEVPELIPRSERFAPEVFTQELLTFVSRNLSEIIEVMAGNGSRIADLGDSATSARSSAPLESAAEYLKSLITTEEGTLALRESILGDAALSKDERRSLLVEVTELLSTEPRAGTHELHNDKKTGAITDDFANFDFAPRGFERSQIYLGDEVSLAAFAIAGGAAVSAISAQVTPDKDAQAAKELEELRTEYAKREAAIAEARAELLRNNLNQTERAQAQLDLQNAESERDEIRGSIDQKLAPSVGFDQAA